MITRQLTAGGLPAFNLAMLNGIDVESLLVDNGEAGSHDGSNTSLASLLQSKGCHGTNGTSSYKENSGLLSGQRGHGCCVGCC